MLSTKRVNRLAEELGSYRDGVVGQEEQHWEDDYEVSGDGVVEYLRCVGPTPTVDGEWSELRFVCL